MIVFSDRKARVDTRSALCTVNAANALDALIRLGQIEAGMADQGVSTETEQRLRECMLETASWYLGYRERPGVPALDVPGNIEVSTPEGFAWYALYPEQYQLAARCFARKQRPTSCHVIGIRSIGTTLSSIVAAELRQLGVRVDSMTVRPSGDPFARQWRASSPLGHDGSHWLIVDEGPGISGSTFASVAEGLSQAGIPDELVAFFPAWDPHPSQLRSFEAGRRWTRHARYTVLFEELNLIPETASDLSGGKWREHVGADVPVHAQWERRKYLSNDGVLWKFVGLGALAQRRIEKARLLATAGFGPRVLGEEHGFILLQWEQGEPPRSGVIDYRRLRDYIRFTATLASNEPMDTDRLSGMIRVNIDEAKLPAIDVAPPVKGDVVWVDGRHLPHEWIGSESQLVKTDGHDHFEDHFFPGCQPVEWDIAGSMVEFDLPAPVLPCRHLDFWTVAYAAFRLGYACMGGPELLPLRQRYRQWLTAPTIERVRSIT